MNLSQVATVVPVRALTSGPEHHFFGYYDKDQWDPGGRYILGMQTPFCGRPVAATDICLIGMIDLEGAREFQPLAETTAWCWQQGCMLQWMPGADSKIIYNHRIGDRFVAVIQDVTTGEKQTLPRPIYSVSGDGKWALSLNFSRLAVKRPGYGYEGLPDGWGDDAAPEQDGVYVMEIETGNHHLLVDLAELAARDPTEIMRVGIHEVNHLLFNPSATRFIFLHRWTDPARIVGTRMYTVNLDGTGRHLVPIDDASHFIWSSDDEILVWAETAAGHHYYLCRDLSSEVSIFADGVLTDNGHCTVSPDRRWVLTDEYPDAERYCPLILYRIADDTRFTLGRFYSMPELTGVTRCDLHPRWSRDGKTICFDSSHEGSRQMYIADVSAIVALEPGEFPPDGGFRS
jgi:hypothetical protein